MCIIGLVFAANSVSCCPAYISMSIETEFCSKLQNLDPLSAKMNICLQLHHTLIANPLETTCNSMPSSAVKLFRITRGASFTTPDFDAFSAAIPLIEGQLSSVIRTWRRNQVHPVLFRLGNITSSDDCPPESYTPLLCRYDSQSQLVTLVVIHNTFVPPFLTQFLLFVSRYNSILTLLLFCVVVAIIVTFGKSFPLKRHPHRRLPNWRELDDNFPSPPLISNPIPVPITSRQ